MIGSRHLEGSRTAKLVLRRIVLFAACGDDGNTTGIPDAVQSARRRRLPVAVAVDDVPEDRRDVGHRLPRRPARSTAMPTNDDGVTVEPDSVQPLRRLLADRADARAFPTGVSAARAADVQEPRRVARAPTRRSCSSTSTPASARRSSPRSIRTRSTSTKRDLIIRPLARLAAGHALRRRDQEHGARPRTVASCSVAAWRSTRCATARTSGIRGSATMKTRCADDRSTRSRRPASRKDDLVLAWDFVTASDEFMRSDLTTMREQALPAIGDDRREPDVHRSRRRSRTSSTHATSATSARTRRPTS